ncbi:Integrase catalytic core protein [Phytophthora palmivora]|uniref:Integrase catalytic core protein n=1 Tax=Phytophthora palmivora TaxID=4796 RepID=A0A2P4YE68_9STRA|nr:Integrase catalytic core protein [Phytophthora palmivora]
MEDQRSEDPWDSNRKTLKNLLVVTKKLNIFQMEPGTRFATHVDQFKEIVFKILTDEYKIISTVLENTPNITLAYVIKALSGVAVSDESPSAEEKAFAVKKKGDGSKGRLGGKCFYCKNQGHKEFKCRKKKSDEERGQVAHEERHDFSFAATSAMSRSEWLVDTGASSHMTSVRDKFVSMKDLKTTVRITIADGTKIDAVATGTVRLKLMDGTTVSLSDVLCIPEFSKDKCVFLYGDAKVMEAMRCGNVYKLKTVGDEVCNVATTLRKEPWAVVHARLGHIPFKRYEQLLTMADGLPEVTDGATNDAVCAGCCMGRMRAYDFPLYPEKLVKSAGVLDPVHTDVMGPMQTKTNGGNTYVVTFIDDYSRHVTVYFMKAKSDILSKFKIFKAVLENATGQRIQRLRSGNVGEYTGS